MILAYSKPVIWWGKISRLLVLNRRLNFPHQISPMIGRLKSKKVFLIKIWWYKIVLTLIWTWYKQSIFDNWMGKIRSPRRQIEYIALGKDKKKRKSLALWRDTVLTQIEHFKTYSMKTSWIFNDLNEICFLFRPLSVIL